MNIYSATGYGSEDANDPRVHQTPLLILEILLEGTG